MQTSLFSIGVYPCSSAADCVSVFSTGASATGVARAQRYRPDAQTDPADRGCYYVVT
jgi:hypothetical protein